MKAIPLDYLKKLLIWDKYKVWQRNVCDKGICVTKACVWQRHLCDKGICVTKAFVWQRHLCDKGICVTKVFVWHRHLCDKGICVTKAFVWQIQLCYKGIICLFSFSYPKLKATQVNSASSHAWRHSSSFSALKLFVTLGSTNRRRDERTW